MPLDPQPEQAPTLPLMHAVFVLAGLGTMLLGPILPLLAAQWHLRDSQLGLLLMAQFIGATLGGVTVSAQTLARPQARPHRRRHWLQRLRPCVLRFCRPCPRYCWEASASAASSPRSTSSRARATPPTAAVALTRLNLTWSFGALLSPLLAAWLIAVPLRARLICFAGVFLLCAIWLNRQPDESSERSIAAAPEPSLAPVRSSSTSLPSSSSTEASKPASAAGSPPTPCAMARPRSFSPNTPWFCCSAASPPAAHSPPGCCSRCTTRTLQRIGLVCSAALAAALATAHRASLIATLAVLLGIALAPIFPATFALLLAHRPPARTAGIILAASGIGGRRTPLAHRRNLHPHRLPPDRACRPRRRSPGHAAALRSPPTHFLTVPHSSRLCFTRWVGCATDSFAVTPLFLFSASSVQRNRRITETWASPPPSSPPSPRAAPSSPPTSGPPAPSAAPLTEPNRQSSGRRPPSSPSTPGSPASSTNSCSTVPNPACSSIPSRSTPSGAASSPPTARSPACAPPTLWLTWLRRPGDSSACTTAAPACASSASPPTLAPLLAGPKPSTASAPAAGYLTSAQLPAALADALAEGNLPVPDAGLLLVDFDNHPPRARRPVRLHPPRRVCRRRTPHRPSTANPPASTLPPTTPPRCVPPLSGQSSC